MTVTAFPRDNSGAVLDSRIASLKTAQSAINAGLSAGAKARIDAELDQAQREAVHHYMTTGRISAATILSTLT